MESEPISFKPMYFAYGSNLSTLDRRLWCLKNRRRRDPLKKAVGVAYLPDAELVFDYESLSREGGALNLKARMGQVVPGVLFEVRDRGWADLDLKEGAPHFYQRRSVHVLNKQGRLLPAVTYEVVPSRRHEFVRPTPDYLDVVREGLREYAVDETMLDAVAENKIPPWTVDGLFSYGTLMRHECRHQYLRQATRILHADFAEAPGRLVHLGEFPGLIPASQPDDTVRGEYFRLEDVGAAIAVTDEIEGFLGYGVAGSLYDRVLSQVRVEGEGECLAWTYTLTTLPSLPRIIKSGCWRSPRSDRS
jgi:gamma-glutamylcyclotransferase (GGCT)/AIG2-like uncharacterized protein YtfP